jgi:DNA modification methylase
MGAGSTIAAAMSVGYESVGVEIDPVFFAMAEKAIPQLARFPANNHVAEVGIQQRLDFRASQGQKSR